MIPAQQPTLKKANGVRFDFMWLQVVNNQDYSLNYTPELKYNISSLTVKDPGV